MALKLKRKANIKMVGAPIRGINAKDAVSDMQETDALQLINYVPKNNSVVLRKGSERHASITGVTAAVQTLMSYSYEATLKLLAACDGKIYDVTAGGAIASSLGTGYTNDKWSYTQMSGHLVMVNGADTPLKYDGSVISTTTITGSGLTASTLSFVKAHQSRLFFIEKDTLNAWYLATSAIAGAASKLDFSAYATKGGVLVAIETWTRDGGSGMDDHIAFLTSEGQVLIYAGTDPASASTWGLIGAFQLPQPIGNRPMFATGSDCNVLTKDGVLSFSKVLPTGGSEAQALALTERIRDKFTSDYTNFQQNFGWEGSLVVAEGIVLVNVPTSSTTAKQYVMNTQTTAWCEFNGWNAFCFAAHDGGTYFGGNNGMIVRCFVGAEDDTLATTQAFQDIVGTVQPAYTYLGTRGAQKELKAINPVFVADSTLPYSFSVGIDFTDYGNIAIPGTGSQTLTAWDEGAWDTTSWGGRLQTIKSWQTAHAVGFTFAPTFTTRTQGIEVKLQTVMYSSVVTSGI
jgi:hypothetical protein